MPTPMPLKTEISDTYPNPSDATARAGFAKLWDYIATLYGKENVIGLVSQVAGVPTGKLIESGLNANGRYARFADGTQICWGNTPLVSEAMTNVFGSVFFSAVLTKTFPANFIALPTVTLAVYSGNSLSWATLGVGSNSYWSGYYVRAISGNDTVSMNFVAVGRWY